MNFDALRLVIVYYPISMLFFFLFVGLFLREIFDFSLLFVRRFIRRRRVRAKRYLEHERYFQHACGGCPSCGMAWEWLCPGDSCPGCANPLVDSGRAYAVFESREAS